MVKGRVDQVKGLLGRVGGALEVLGFKDALGLQQILELCLVNHDHVLRVPHHNSICLLVALDAVHQVVI